MKHLYTKAAAAIMLMLATVLATGCVKENPTNQEVELVSISCTVDLQGSARDGLSVMTVGSGFSLSSDSTQLGIQVSDMPQLIIVADSYDHVRMLYRGVLHEGQSIEVTSHTTALAMVSCNPTIAMLGDSDFVTMTSIIENLQSFPAFESVVESAIEQGDDLFDTTNTQLIEKLQVVYDEVLNTAEDLKSDSKSDSPFPWANYEPLEIEWATPSNPAASGRFYIRNTGLTPSYYGKITSTSGMSKDVVVKTVDKVTLGTLALGMLPGQNAFRGPKEVVTLYRDANNIIELTNWNDNRAIIDFGAHVVGDIITALSLPVDIKGDEIMELATIVGTTIFNAISGDGPHPYKAIAQTALSQSLEWLAKFIEKKFLQASEKAWAKKICEIGMKRILAFYNTAIGGTNLVGRITCWAVNPHDISFCVWYGRDDGVMTMDECKDIYRVEYEVQSDAITQGEYTNFNIDIFLSGDAAGLNQSEEFGYYIQYSNEIVYHPVERLNSSMYDNPYTLVLPVHESSFQLDGDQRVARGYYIGFYVVRNNHNTIDTYDEQEIEGLISPCDCNLTSGDWVDLGLPSGLLWATRNVGASSPTDYGNYYAWGETSPKSVYSWSTYRYARYDSERGDYYLAKYCTNSSYGYNGFTDGLTTLQPGDDAATANYGGRTPTKAEWEELDNNTTSRSMTVNGVNGLCFTGPNGNSLFLPGAGYRDGSFYEAGGGYYWSSSLDTDFPYDAWGCSLYYGGVIMDRYCYRSDGRPVRAVR